MRRVVAACRASARGESWWAALGARRSRFASRCGRSGPTRPASCWSPGAGTRSRTGLRRTTSSTGRRRSIALVKASDCDRRAAVHPIRRRARLRAARACRGRAGRRTAGQPASRPARWTAVADRRADRQRDDRRGRGQGRDPRHPADRWPASRLALEACGRRPRGGGAGRRVRGRAARHDCAGPQAEHGRRRWPSAGSCSLASAIRRESDPAATPVGWRRPRWSDAAVAARRDRSAGALAAGVRLETLWYAVYGFRSDARSSSRRASRTHRPRELEAAAHLPSAPAWC